MAFKGTHRHSQQALELEVENMGAHLNAYTSREQTVHYAKAFRQGVLQVVAIVSDLLQNSKLEEAKIERERGVTLRQQFGVDKQYEEVVFDPSHVVAFQDLQHHPTPCLGPGNLLLGQQLILQNIRSIKRADLEACIKTNYTTGRMLLVGVGGVGHASLVQLA